MPWWTDSSGRIELEMTLQQAQSCSHPGPCDADVRVLSQDPEIQRQLEALDPQQVAACLREYGAWEDDELTDHPTNLQRLLWLAAGDITEET